MTEFKYKINEILNKRITFLMHYGIRTGRVVAVVKVRGTLNTTVYYINHILVEIQSDYDKWDKAYIEIAYVTTDLNDNTVISDGCYRYFESDLTPSTYKKYLGKDIIKYEYNEKAFR